MISLELNFQGFSYYGIGLSDQDFIIGVDQCHIGFYPTSPALDQWQWIWPFPTFYIYIMLCKITRAQALFQYLIWCYHISSWRHEDCILFDRFELWHASQQQCCSTALNPPGSLRHVSNFQVKQSRIFETSWDLESAAVDKETSGCVGNVCCYARGFSLSLWWHLWSAAAN